MKKLSIFLIQIYAFVGLFSLVLYGLIKNKRLRVFLKHAGRIDFLMTHNVIVFRITFIDTSNFIGAWTPNPLRWSVDDLFSTFQPNSTFEVLLRK